MSKREPKKVSMYPYEGGNKVTPRLRDALGAESFKVLARLLEMPRTTISTWHSRGVTPYEAIIRVHLATGVPIRWLIMGQGSKDGSKPEVQPEVVRDVKSCHLPIYSVSNGELVEIRKFSFDLEMLSRYSLTPDNVTIIDHDDELLFIHGGQTNVVVGRYLIGMDGVFTINRLQRLPARVIEITYGDRSYEVSPSEIHVSGKVVMSIGKE